MLSRHDFYPFGAEIDAQPSDALLTDGFESGDLTAWGDGPDELAVKYTGHERDLHRLSDYMRGRTCLYPLRRFASPDPGRDGWNLYSYTLNNPVRYVDPDGEFAETAWDAFSLGLGLASLAKNVREGNVGGALLDGAGVVLDGLAAATPFVPGGAGSGIRALRAGDGARAIARGGAAPVRAGQAGEDAVRATYSIGDKARIGVPGTQRNRIPDGITEDEISEVKNRASQSFTQQIRDLLSIARSSNRDFILYVRTDTRLTAPLREAVAKGEIILRAIPE